MIPQQLDITIYRGSSFEIELVGQIKDYVFDPAVNNTPADLKRSHEENLKKYGFVFEYIDFLTLYSAATLEIRKSWLKSGSAASTPLFALSLGSGLTLTDDRVQIGITAEQTSAMDFDSGTYDLLLVTASGKVDKLVYGKVEVIGETE